MHSAFGKHLIQSRERLRCPGEDHEAAHRTIQTMYYTEKYGSRLMVLFFQIVLHNIREGTIASLIALHDLPALFVDDYNMVILVDDLHRLTCSCHHRLESPDR